MAQQISTNTFGCAKWIVSSDATQGTHTTIGGALTSASSGDTIFIRPGTYTENLTLKAGVNLSAYPCDSYNNVIIKGKCSFTTAGAVSISGIKFATNGDYAISVTGTANSSLFVIDCYIESTDHTAILMNTTGAIAAASFMSCQLNLATTGVAFFTATQCNNIHFIGCFLNNGAGSTTASDCAHGNALLEVCSTFGAFSSSSVGSIGLFNCNADTSAINTTTVTANGTGSNVVTNCYIASGTASCFSVGAGAVLAVASTVTNTSNTNVSAGAGQLTYSGLSNLGSKAYSTTTLLGGLLPGGVNQAPSAGYLGEVITSAVTSVATTSGTAKTITSISLTAGIWDVSGITTAAATGGTATIAAHIVGISTTNNTLTGNTGDDQFQINASGSVLSGSVPQKRITLTATTTYYLVVLNLYTSTTCPTNGRITATRVG